MEALEFKVDEQETEIERLQRRCKSYERELELKRDEESLF